MTDSGHPEPGGEGDGPANDSGTPTGAPVPRPRWSYVIPWAGQVPALSAVQWKILGLLSAAEVFDNFDVGLMLLALAQIQTDLGIPEADVGWMTGVIRLGVLPALAITLFADRLGRRRLLLFTVLGLTLTTFLTSFVQTPTQFIILQFLARTFAYSETALAVVVLTEELSERDRGWGIGMLAALGAMGHALAALTFGFVELLPFGWRALYFIGAAPLVFLAWLRRELPETARFASVEHHARQGSWWTPAWLLLQAYPWRLAAIAGALVPLEFVIMAGYTFAPKTLQEVHGFSPAAVGTLYILGGAIGILGNLVAGQLGDSWGRRRVLMFFTTVAALAFGGFYGLEGTPLQGTYAIVPFWILQVFSLMGVSVIFKAFGTELFSTSHRSTASGLRAAIGTLGGVLGLTLESLLYEITGSHSQAIIWMLPVLLISPVVAWFALPETAGRKLEEISPEKG